jgi:hypothetical protein
MQSGGESGSAGDGTNIQRDNKDTAAAQFKGSTYAMIQEQLRSLENFTGDPKKI